MQSVYLAQKPTYISYAFHLHFSLWLFLNIWNVVGSAQHTKMCKDWENRISSWITKLTAITTTTKNTEKCLCALICRHFISLASYLANEFSQLVFIWLWLGLSRILNVFSSYVALSASPSSFDHKIPNLNSFCTYERKKCYIVTGNIIRKPDIKRPPVYSSGAKNDKNSHKSTIHNNNNNAKISPLIQFGWAKKRTSSSPNHLLPLLIEHFSNLTALRFG